MIQSIDSVETYAYGTNEELIHRKEEIKCNNINNNMKAMTILQENKNKHNLNWPRIPDHPQWH